MNTPIILYVDDERPNRVVFEQSFGTRFKVRCAASGEEALEIFQSEPVAVVVTDQRMPGMSGNELLARVKAHWPRTVRVVITAYSDLDAILAAVNDGLVARYLIKPWERAELDGILRWAIDAWSLGLESAALQLRLLETERLITLGTVAGAFVHDLKGPLTNINLLVDECLALTGSAKGRKLTRRELPELLVDIKKDCAIMTDIIALINAYLERRPALRQECDPMPIVRYVLSVCTTAATDARASLRYDGPTDLPRLKIGPAELSQVLINLLQNAAQALEARPPQRGRGLITLRISPEDGRVGFTVEDNGPGMPADVLAQLGTAFFTTREGGTGLGILQCRRIAGKYGGELTIDSDPGKGTRVHFGLQLAV